MSKLNGKAIVTLSCVWHVQWSENKVELFAPNWKFVAGSRDSGNGAIYEQIAKTMNEASVKVAA